jgi:hypothetical protein
MCLKEMGCGLDRFGLGEEKAIGFFECGSKLADSIQGGNFLTSWDIISI